MHSGKYGAFCHSSIIVLWHQYPRKLKCKIFAFSNFALLASCAQTQCLLQNKQWKRLFGCQNTGLIADRTIKVHILSSTSSSTKKTCIEIKIDKFWLILYLLLLSKISQLRYNILLKIVAICRCRFSIESHLMKDS